jgi:predicted DNA-binding protein
MSTENMYVNKQCQDDLEKLQRVTGKTKRQLLKEAVEKGIQELKKDWRESYGGGR